MSRAEQIVQEIDRLAPGLLDYTVTLHILQRQPTKLEMDHLNSLVPVHCAGKVQYLLNKYQQIAEEPEEDDRWFIAYRFAKTDEERTVLNRLQEAEKEWDLLQGLHTRIVDLEEKLTEAHAWPPAGMMLTLLKPQHAAIHTRLDSLKGRLEHLQQELLEYTKLARTPTVGDA